MSSSWKGHFPAKSLPMRVRAMPADRTRVGRWTSFLMRAISAGGMGMGEDLFDIQLANLILDILILIFNNTINELDFKVIFHF